MTTTRDARRARMAAATSRRAEPDAAPAGRTATRARPVRITVDLSPPAHRELQKIARDAADAMDAPSVALVDVVRAMLRVTAADSGVRAEVIDQIRRTRE
jgi:hypothetical protein